MQLVNIALSLIPLLVLAACSRQPQGEVADTVYTNGRVYTVDEAQPWAEAVAIADGKFIVVGSNEEVQAATGKDTEVIDLNGAFAMPGVQDAHLHPSTGGQNLDNATGGFVFTEDMTRAEIQAALADFAEANPGRLLGLAYRDDPLASAQYLTTDGNPYAAVATDKGSLNALNFGLTGVPETYVFSAEGTLLFRSPGPLVGALRSQFEAAWEAAIQ